MLLPVNPTYNCTNFLYSSLYLYVYNSLHAGHVCDRQ